MGFEMEVRYGFHGVGQGLFSSGSLELFSRIPGRKFNWVYDCGTDSSQRYLDSALNDLQHDIPTLGVGRPYLDLVTISHFDTDHISGLVKLLERFDVGDLLLPYMPLWQRLVIAFHAHRAHRSRLTSFLVNPVAFITAVPEANIKRILFASGGPPLEDPPRGADVPREPKRPPATGEQDEKRRGMGPDFAVVDTEELSDLDAADDRRLDGEYMKRAARNGTRVAYMRYRGAVVVAGCWEFLPYNDAQLAPMASTSFRDQVSLLRDDLLGGVKAVTTRALIALKTLYTAEFDFNGQRENPNLISLFLYAGPISPRGTEIYARHVTSPHGWSFRLSDKGGVLYTGDGYINTPARFNSMQAFLCSHRVDNLAVLQVMHHGATANWQAGLAGKIKPEFSVFSSNPLHKGFRHPHTVVSNDFASYRPLQASKGVAVNVALWMF